jgi:hypothetical protein
MSVKSCVRNLLTLAAKRGCDIDQLLGGVPIEARKVSA